MYLVSSWVFCCTAFEGARGATVCTQAKDEARSCFGEYDYFPKEQTQKTKNRKWTTRMLRGKFQPRIPVFVSQYLNFLREMDLLYSSTIIFVLFGVGWVQTWAKLLIFWTLMNEEIRNRIGLVLDLKSFQIFKEAAGKLWKSEPNSKTVFPKLRQKQSITAIIFRSSAIVLFSHWSNKWVY